MAIKMLYHGNARRMAANAREIAILKKAQHKNIVRLHEVIQDDEDGTCYLVMQYVDHGALVKD